MNRGPQDGEVRERDLFALPADAPIMPLVPVETGIQTRPPASLSIRQMLDARARAASLAFALEYDRGILALLMPVALGVGALIYLAAPVEPQLLQLLLGVLVLAAIAFVARERPATFLVTASILVVLTGAVAAKFETWRAGTRVLGGEISTRMTGRVVDIDHLANGRVRLTLDVLETARPKLRYQPQRVRVSASSIPDNVLSGTVVSGFARLQPPPGPIRPGSYDFSFESYFDGVGANGFFLGKPQLAADAASAPLRVRFRAALDNTRNAIANRIRTAIGGPEGEIAAALTVGVRAGIPEDVNEALRRTGLAHILSISGLHMALVAAAVMVSVRLLMAGLPGFAATHPTKKYAAAIALLVLSAYLFISGAEVAAQRSFIMLAVMLVAVLFDRQALTMRNLAIAAIIVLLISPHEIVGPSFQMSFAATAALIGGYGWWSSRRRPQSKAIARDQPFWRRAVRWSWLAVAGIAATAIIAGLATSIYGVWHFQRVSPLTLLANLAVTPIVSLVVMPFGLLSMLAMPFGLDGPFLAIMGKGLQAMLAVSEYLSARSPLDAIGLVPGWSVVLFTVALLIGTLASTRLRYAALPFLGAGFLLLPARSLPDAFVSEDARLVGIRAANGDLLVNRQRPNAFTAMGWQRALAASAIVKPIIDQAEPNAADKLKTGEPAPERLPYDIAQTILDQADEKAFRCRGPLCVVKTQTGDAIAVAADAWTAQQVCRKAALVVVQQARARSACGDGRTNIITARTLALRGAATILFNDAQQNTDSNQQYTVTYAIGDIYRPWHDNRRFSRAARGMEPYQRKPRTKPGPPAVKPAQ